VLGVPALSRAYLIPSSGYRPEGLFPPGLTRPGAAASTPATVIVLVPEGAEVLFDGKPSTRSGPRQEFVTPALEPGRTYTLGIRVRTANWARTMQLPVRAGDKATVDMTR
jgi:uncharacterized protein (TIGR03000 family)